MKKGIFLLIYMLLFVACETGVKHDDNVTVKPIPPVEIENSNVDKSIEDLLDDEEEFKRVHKEIMPKESYEENVNEVLGLEVSKIREGIHDGYLRLVFDILEDTKPAYKVGSYETKYSASKKSIEVILHDYKKFSASIPNFHPSSEIKDIVFVKYPKGKGYKFYIQLHKEAEVKVFDLRNPARLVFDINGI